MEKSDCLTCHEPDKRTVGPSFEEIARRYPNEKSAVQYLIKKVKEGVDPARGGLRVSVQPGGCSGFKYGLLIEDQNAEDDVVLDQGGFKVFVDPFSAQYISGVVIDYTTSMQGSGFTFKNPNATGGCGCGSSFSA